MHKSRKNQIISQTHSSNTSPGRIAPVVRPYTSMSTGSTPKKSRPQSRQEHIQVKEKEKENTDEIELKKQQLLQEILNKESAEDQDAEDKPEQPVDDEEAQGEGEEENEPKDDDIIIRERPKSAASWNSTSSKVQYIKRLEELLRQERSKGSEARKKSRDITSKD